MTLHERLKNWGRTYRVGKHRGGHCYSVEWRTQGWHTPPDAAQIEWLHQRCLITDEERQDLMDARPAAKPEPVDHKDAAIIERAWGTFGNERYKFAMKKHYVFRWTRYMVGRKLREREIDNFFSICEHKFAKQIDFVTAQYADGLYPLMQIIDSASVHPDLRIAA